MKNDLGKQELYEGVKTLVECEAKNIHLPQHKLFTLYSCAFQYMLYCSTKKAGAYIIRIEDSQLTDKLARKSKDSSTRKFLQTIALPRKFKYGKSTFYLDFFHIGSWNLTSEIPKEKIQGAIIVKNSSNKPMDEKLSTEDETDESVLLASLPKDYHINSLTDFCPKTIVIAFEEELDETFEKVVFPFIKVEEEKTLSGVTISDDIQVQD